MVPSHCKVESSFLTQFYQLGKDTDRLSFRGSIRAGYHGLAVWGTDSWAYVCLEGERLRGEITTSTNVKT
jgi:hypothetical protein